jgi:hypothetical protein
VPRALKGREDGERKPWQKFFERGERMEHPAVEVAQPGIDEMGMRRRRRADQQGSGGKPAHE